MSVTTADAEAARAEEAASLANAAAAQADLASATLNHDAPFDALAANAATRSQLRREVDKRELRMAGRDIAEGLRGIIRAAPFVAVMAGVAAGLAIGGRRHRRRSVVRKT
jgi:hypothetical protein